MSLHVLVKGGYRTIDLLEFVQKGLQICVTGSAPDSSVGCPIGHFALWNDGQRGLPASSSGLVDRRTY